MVHTYLSSFGFTNLDKADLKKLVKDISLQFDFHL